MKTLFLILTLLPCAVLAGADELKPSVIDADALLRQMELNVLTRQYEKALTEYYETQLQLQLVSAIDERDNLSKEEVDRRTKAIELRVRLLKEWQSDIRHRIVTLVEEQNAREKARPAKDQKSAAPPEKKAASPSERAPAPKF